MIHYLQATLANTPEAQEAARKSAEAAAKAKELAEGLTTGDIQFSSLLRHFIDWGIDAGKHLIAAFLIYLIGHYLIKLLNYLLARFLERRNVEATVQTFLRSFVSILLQVMLIVAVVGALGVNTTSFAALLASFGVAVGMALSGNLQNFAGGIVILFLRPYKVGDWLEAQGTAGTVVAIQIFHTILLTADGKQIYIPNGAMSSGSITNYNQTPTRRVEWTIGVEYDTDITKVRELLTSLVQAEKRILPVPEPSVFLKELGDSSVNILIRGWVNNADYWDVLFSMNEKIYNSFNENDISFPFPQLTVHQG